MESLRQAAVMLVNDHMDVKSLFDEVSGTVNVIFATRSHVLRQAS